MKFNKWTIGLCAALTIGSNVTFAQTVTNVDAVPNQIPPAANGGFTLSSLFGNGVGPGLKQGALDLVHFVENTTNNGIVSIEAGALYATKTKAIGGFVDAYLPVGGTNSVFGAGIGFAYLDLNFYDATLNARLGDTFNIPFIHIPLYAYVESGGGYNLSQNQVIAQAFSGALLKIPVTQNSTLTIGGAVGTISDYSGNILAFGGSYTWKF